MPVSQLSHGPSQSFPYRIEMQIGEGAMGIVYRAIDVVLERPVAIKVLKSGGEDQAFADERRKRFLQEARAAAALPHPGVTTVHQIGEIDGSPYLVMEWLEGKNLAEVLEHEGSMPLDRAAGYLLDLLDVLEAAHRAGVVHRDIKPSNLIVLDSGRLKITDFGIARLQQGRELVKTVAGTVLATPQYASPEQLEGRRVDGRSDLFSAAVVFYQLMTGVTPWRAETLSKLIQAVFVQAPAPVREHDPRLPAWLDRWFEKALAKDSGERFSNALEMSLALKQAIGPPTAEATVNTQTSAPTTHLMAAPLSLFVAPSARDPWQAVTELLSSWGSQNLGIQSRDDLLAKLLDIPLHAKAFAGAALFGRHCLLIEEGVVVAAIDVESGRPDRDADLPEKGPTRLLSAPHSLKSGTVSLLANITQPARPRFADLDTQAVYLPAFAGKLLEQGFRGLLRLDASQGRFAVILLLDKLAELALFSAGWEQDPCEVGWESWLSSISATASFYDLQVAPPALWYRSGMRHLDVEVTADLPIPTSKSETATLTAALAAQLSDQHNLFQTRMTAVGGKHKHGLVSPAETPAARFLAWMLDELPSLLVDRRQAEAWKYLGDWLLLIRRSRLYSDLERHGSRQTDAFDVITEDADGKVLHVAHRLGHVDEGSLQAFVDRVVTAKEARKKRGDIGGAILISPHFDQAVLQAYRSLLHRGLGNRLLGLDKSMGYAGFVRLSSRRGFHLLLVEERDDGYRPLFIS